MFNGQDFMGRHPSMARLLKIVRNFGDRMRAGTEPQLRKSQP
jgi:hypothetical protein